MLINFISGLFLTNAEANISISPVNVTFQPDQKIASLTIRNTGNLPRTFQLQVVKWSNPKSKDFDEDVSKDWIISPVLITLPHDKQQIVRLSPKNKQASLSEKNYRLLIREIPTDAKDLLAAIKFRFTFVVPVFLEPKTPSEAKVSAHIQKDGNHSLMLIKNESNCHLDLGIIDCGNTQQHSLYGYVFNQSEFTIENPCKPTKTPEKVTLQYGYRGEILKTHATFDF